MTSPDFLKRIFLKTLHCKSLMKGGGEKMSVLCCKLLIALTYQFLAHMKQLVKFNEDFCRG